LGLYLRTACLRRCVFSRCSNKSPQQKSLGSRTVRHLRPFPSQQRFVFVFCSSPNVPNLHPLQSNSPNVSPFRTIAFFPWSNDSLHTLWDGNLYNSHSLVHWKQMVSDFSDAVAIGSLRKAYIFFTQRSKNPICVSLPQVCHFFVFRVMSSQHSLFKDKADLKVLPTDAVNVAWTLDPNSPFEPLLIFSYLNLLYIYNVKRKGICSYLRGHGGVRSSLFFKVNLTRTIYTGYNGDRRASPNRQSFLHNVQRLLDTNIRPGSSPSRWTFKSPLASRHRW
jgi:hypothetical protein